MATHNWISAEKRGRIGQPPKYNVFCTSCFAERRGLSSDDLVELNRRDPGFCGQSEEINYAGATSYAETYGKVVITDEQPRYAVNQGETEFRGIAAARVLVKRIGLTRALFTSLIGALNSIPANGVMYKAVPIIGGEQNGIMRLRMCSRVADETGVDRVYIAQRVGEYRATHGITVQSWEQNEAHLRSLFEALE